jgi:hypothetical protein
MVFAAALLGAGACSKKPAPQAPKNTATDPKGADPQMMTGDKKPDPAMTPGGEDPCAPPAK